MTYNTTLASRLQSEIDVVAMGAAGDGITDDSGVFAAAIALSNTRIAAGHFTCIKVGAGNFLIKNTSLPTFIGAGSIIGDGSNRTFITVDATYAGGDVFSWSECWYAGNYGTPALTLSAAKAGPFIQGITISGSRNASANQHALRFYDRNDSCTIRDVDVWDIKGSGFSCGRVKNQSQGYMRESQFYNFRIFQSGDTSFPACEISSISTSGSDATNELDFFKLAIFGSYGVGLTVSNPNQYSGVRGIRFYSLRVESAIGAGVDCVQIGLETDTGQVAGVFIHGFEGLVGTVGSYAINISGGSIQTYSVGIYGAVIGNTGNGSGIRINNARLVTAVIDSINAPNSGNYCVTFGNLLGSQIKFVSNGQAALWTYNYSASGLSYGILSTLIIDNVRGLPNASIKSGQVTLFTSTTGSSAARLTQDGTTANAQNCFNVGFSKAYNLSIQLLAYDSTTTSKYYLWCLPICYYSSIFGSGTASVSIGTPVTLTGGTVTGASVSLTADTTNGGLNLSFTPPTANTDSWTITATVTFTQSP